MNTNNGDVEPKKISKVDMREAGQAHIFYTDGSSENVELENYRNMVAIGQIYVDDAEFIPNASNTVVLPVSPENMTNPEKSDTLLPVFNTLESLPMSDSDRFAKFAYIYVAVVTTMLFVLALVSLLLR